MTGIRFEIPVTIRSANVIMRAHPMENARHAKSDRRTTNGAALAANIRRFVKASSPPYRVTFTRCYGGRAKEFDEGDNLALGFKAVRDEIAKLLGTGDAPDSGVTWKYRQVRTAHAERCPFVIAEIEMSSI